MGAASSTPSTPPTPEEGAQYMDQRNKLIIATAVLGAAALVMIILLAYLLYSSGSVNKALGRCYAAVNNGPIQEAVVHDANKFYGIK